MLERRQDARPALERSNAAGQGALLNPQRHRPRQPVTRGPTLPRRSHRGHGRLSPQAPHRHRQQGQIHKDLELLGPNRIDPQELSRSRLLPLPPPLGPAFGRSLLRQTAHPQPAKGRRGPQQLQRHQFLQKLLLR